MCAEASNLVKGKFGLLLSLGNNGHTAMSGSHKVTNQVDKSSKFFFIGFIGKYGWFLAVELEWNQLRVCKNALSEANKLNGRSVASEEFDHIRIWEYLENTFHRGSAIRVYNLGDITKDCFLALEQPRNNGILHRGVILHLIDQQVFYVIV